MLMCLWLTGLQAWGPVHEGSHQRLRFLHESTLAGGAMQDWTFNTDLA